MVTGPAKVLLASCVMFVVTFLIWSAITMRRISDKENIRNLVGLCIIIVIMMIAIYDVNSTSLRGSNYWAWSKSLVFTALIFYAIYSIIKFTRKTLSISHTTTESTNGEEHVS